MIKRYIKIIVIKLKLVICKLNTILHVRGNPSKEFLAGGPASFRYAIDCEHHTSCEWKGGLYYKIRLHLIYRYVENSWGRILQKRNLVIHFFKASFICVLSLVRFVALQPNYLSTKILELFDKRHGSYQYKNTLNKGKPQTALICLKFKKEKKKKCHCEKFCRMLMIMNLLTSAELLTY